MLEIEPGVRVGEFALRLQGADFCLDGRRQFLPQRLQINSVPYGAAFKPENQDLTKPASTLPGAQALVVNKFGKQEQIGRGFRRISAEQGFLQFIDLSGANGSKG